jgi:hypothetical protein
MRWSGGGLALPTGSCTFEDRRDGFVAANLVPPDGRRVGYETDGSGIGVPDGSDMRTANGAMPPPM